LGGKGQARKMAPEWLFPAWKWLGNGAFSTRELLSVDRLGFELMMDSGKK
jgi:hypothetical protein